MGREHYPNTVRLLMTGFAELEDAVDAINLGRVYHYLMKPCRTEELLQILRMPLRRFGWRANANTWSSNCAASISNWKSGSRTHAELEEANPPAPTACPQAGNAGPDRPADGLLNRRAIDDVARKEIQPRRYPSTLALGLLDVDHFKNINTQYLISGGDEVLVGLAKVLANSVRTVDAVSRIGGEEFLVVAPETALDGATVLAERIRATVAQPADLLQRRADPHHGERWLRGGRGGHADGLRSNEVHRGRPSTRAKNSGRNRCPAFKIIPPLSNRHAEAAAEFSLALLCPGRGEEGKRVTP